MKLRSVILPVGALLMLGACVAPSRPPAPAPVPVPVQAPPPRPVAAPAPPPVAAASTSWAEAALSAGNWSYRTLPPGSVATYGAAASASLVVRCAGNRQVQLQVPGAPSGNAITFRTSSLTRAIPAAPGAGGLIATLPAADPLLDALIFSRGRFGVEAGGTSLVVPTWPELARVVEDCRR